MTMAWWIRRVVRALSQVEGKARGQARLAGATGLLTFRRGPDEQSCHKDGNWS